MSLEDLERELTNRARGGAPSFSEKARVMARSVALAAAAVLGLAVVVGGGLYLFFSREAARGVVLAVETPTEVMSGVPFDLVVNAENEIDSIAREAVVTVSLPEGVASLSALAGGSATVEESIGDIGARSLAKRTFRLVATGEPDEEREIEISITYLSGGRSRFRTEEKVSVAIGEPGITLAVRMPERVIGGSAFEFAVEYENVSPFDFSGAVLEIRYPDSFTFESASLPPDSLDNYWRLGALYARSKGTLTIKGRIAAGGEASAAAFPVSVSANFLGKDYVVAKTEARAELAPSPLFLEIATGGADTARTGDFLSYTVRYRNQTGVTLADLVIRASLTGEMYDLGSVATQGKFDAAARAVTFDASNVPALRLLDPGAEGEVTLAVGVRSSFPVRRISDKNFSVRLAVFAESPTVPSYLSAEKTTAAGAKEIKIAGFVLAAAEARYRDAATGIVNAGPFPPKAGAATEYAVHWILKNYATDVERVTVRAALPPGAEWTGVVQANGGVVPRFEESSREVVWEIEKIPAAKGVVNAPLEAVFQVRATPAASQAGNFQTILLDTALTATDAWTGLALASRAAALTTRLEGDPTVAPDQGRVVP